MNMAEQVFCGRIKLHLDMWSNPNQFILRLTLVHIFLWNNRMDFHSTLQVCTPFSNGWVLTLLHILASMSSYSFSWSKPFWKVEDKYLEIVFICISLINKDVEYFKCFISLCFLFRDFCLTLHPIFQLGFYFLVISISSFIILDYFSYLGIFCVFMWNWPFKTCNELCGNYYGDFLETVDCF